MKSSCVHMYQWFTSSASGVFIGTHTPGFESRCTDDLSILAHQCFPHLDFKALQAAVMRANTARTMSGSTATSACLTRCHKRPIMRPRAITVRQSATMSENKRRIDPPHLILEGVRTDDYCQFHGLICARRG